MLGAATFTQESCASGAGDAANAPTVDSGATALVESGAQGADVEPGRTESGGNDEADTDEDGGGEGGDDATPADDAGDDATLGDDDGDATVDAAVGRADTGVVDAVVNGADTSITDAPVGVACAGLPAWFPGTTALTVRNQGEKYTCLVEGWCSESNSAGVAAYEPGTGWAWTTAWQDAGPCGAGD